MFKKSHALSTAGILLLAVLFVLAGCQNPEAPVVNQGDTSVQFPEFPDQVGPSEVSVTTTNNGPEAKLPAGLNYPDAGAKVMTGNADDIILAFNGGILVADTSDATGGTVVPLTGTTTVGGSNLSGGDAYIQDGVDQILWTGAGSRGGAPLGAIIVPPGKTLFIGGDLVINGDGDNGTFTGIRVLDKGGYAPAAAGEEPSLSILAATGANVGSGDSAGKIVFLAGSKVTVGEASSSPALAGTFTVGGDLEIHRGAAVDLSAALTHQTPFVATEGSAIDVYGSLSLGAAANTIKGKLNINAGAKVDAALEATGLVFGDDVTLNGTLTLPAATVPVTFNGNLTVGANTSLTLKGTATALTTFNKTAAFNGYLRLSSTAAAATDVNYAVGPSGELVIKKGGLIGHGLWLGDAAQLLGAFKAEKADKTENARVIIEDPGEAAVYNLSLALSVSKFADLKDLAVHKNLHLASLTYTGSETFTNNEELLVTEGNNVVWNATPLPPKVTVEDGGAITLGAVNSAGAITLIGGGRKAYTAPSDTAFTLAAAALDVGSAPFATKLDKLTIGDGKVATSVTIGSGTAAFAPKTGEIVVEKKAALTVGAAASTTSIDIPGTITLEKGDDAEGGDLGGQFTVATPATPPAVGSFGSTKTITVGKNAKFDATGLGNTVTFAGLTTLTVDAGGSLSIASTGVAGTPTADLFKALQEKIGVGSEVVKGDGSFVAGGWIIENVKDHAFDQILGIKNVTVASINADVPNTSGFADGYTKDREDTDVAGSTLTVNTIKVPAGGLVVDRNLNVAGSGTITFSSATTPLTIKSGKTISAGGTEVLNASSGDAVLIPNTGATVLTAATTAGVFNGTVGGLTLTTGHSLKISGELALAAGTFTAGGDDVAAGRVVLTGAASGTSLKDVDIAPVAPSTSAVTLTINKEGVLSNGGISTVGKGSVIAAKADAQIKGTANTLSFGGGSIGVGVLQSTSDTSTIKVDDITASTPVATVGKATISGAWKGVSGTALTGGASGTESLVISGSVEVGGTDYDSAKLTGSTLAKGVVFDAANGKIVLGTNGTLTGGKLTTTGKGLLEIVSGSAPNTLTTGGGELDIGTATLAAGGVQDGILDLNKGVLTLGAAFGVGTSGSTGKGADTSPTEIELKVSGTGKIANGNTITVLSVSGTAGNSDWKKGKLSIGSNVIIGVDKTAGTLLQAVAGVTPETIGTEYTSTSQYEVKADELYGAFVAGSASSRIDTPAAGSKVDLSSGNITIAKTGSSDVITANSRFVSTTE